MTLFLLGLLFGVAVGALGAGALARARLLSRLARPNIELGPYRTKLDVVQEKVYCKDCKHLKKGDGLYINDRCWLGPFFEDPVHGKYRGTRTVSANENYDCKDWEEK